uniref:Uncharacterized protein n=1 Tax=uncultured bacterium BLR5 TaxID=506522 RepID=C0INW5_9BACT|nr:hypothetical protein AKSOIL_0041 [uncultured bacterium BLR5]
MRPITSRLRPPNAKRTPISRVHSVTLAESTPMTKVFVDNDEDLRQ